MESDIIKGIKSETVVEIELLERDYEIIKNFLKGTRYDFPQIRTTLQSFKDRLSKVRSLLVTYFQMQGKQFDFQTRPMLDNIDMALVLMEVVPDLNWEKARGILQLSLAVAGIKIEDIMAFISTLKKTTFS